MAWSVIAKLPKHTSRQDIRLQTKKTKLKHRFWQKYVYLVKMFAAWVWFQHEELMIKEPTNIVDCTFPYYFIFLYYIQN